MRYVGIKTLKRSRRRAEVVNLAVSRNENYLVNGIALHNCRCSVILVDRWDLEKMGLIKGNHVIRKEPAGFAAAGPDEGFGGRTDQRIYG